MNVKKADVLHHDFIECLRGTGLGHVWERYPDTGRRYKAFANTARYRRKCRLCVRCKTIKTGIWDRITGKMYKPWAYDYPVEFHLPGQLDTKMLRKWYEEVFED